MSSGTVLSLQLKGVQNAIVDMDPQYTLFSRETKNPSPFAREPKLFYNNQNNIGFGKRYRIEVPAFGDLYDKFRFRVQLPALDNGLGRARWVDDVGRAMFEEIKLEFSSLEVDMLTPEFMHVLDEYLTATDKRADELTGKFSTTAALVDFARTTRVLYIEIPIWWSKEPGMNFPVVSAFLSKMWWNIKIRAKNELVVGVDPAYTAAQALDVADIVAFNFHAETILLSEQERDVFAAGYFIYVIEQHQTFLTTIRAGVTTARVEFRLNHPVKELFIVLRRRAAILPGVYNWFDFSGLEPAPYAGEAFTSMRFLINNNVRIEETDPLYYRLVHPKMHHTRLARKHIYSYSFALNPELTDPNGALNFSRLDFAALEFKFAAALPGDLDCFVMALNHNAIEVENGIVKLAFGG
jgi:Large eukaryotic DNA virus major capsid protein/Major capsid protein N-terminus